MSTVDTLVAARALIEDPANWIKGAHYRVFEGRECYCAVGALDQVAANWPLARKALYNHLPPRQSIAGFNDDPATTHADVLALFDRAIAGERAKAVSA